MYDFIDVPSTTKLFTNFMVCEFHLNKLFFKRNKFLSYCLKSYILVSISKRHPVSEVESTSLFFKIPVLPERLFVLFVK